MDDYHLLSEHRKIYQCTKMKILKLSLFIYLYLHEHLSLDKENFVSFRAKKIEKFYKRRDERKFPETKMILKPDQNSV